MSGAVGTAVAWALVCIVGGWLLLPGIHGAFLLDDYQNLKLLADILPPLTFGQIGAYVDSALAGPLGRPLALASFAVQYQAWPDAPSSFKAVNLALHLANGTLLLLLFRALARAAGEPRIAIIGFAVAALWLIHPLQSSTVFYVVQRMTLLATTFTLAGLMAWVRGRELAAQKRASGFAWMSGGILVGGTLATLSKETGVLIVLYALVLEATLLRGLARPAAVRTWLAVFLLLPAAALVGYFAWRWPQLAAAYAQRDFTLEERLLSQARALADYLRLALFPRPSELGLFQDDYPVSRGLLDPPSTLAAVVLVAALGATALYLRKARPWIAFGLLWFIAGHLLESTALPLELYFEHRNYLPLAGVLFCAGAVLAHAAEAARPRPAYSLAAVVAAVWLLGIAWVARGESQLWGNPARQAVHWAREHSESVRAQETLGNLQASSGLMADAAQTFRGLARGARGYAPGYVLWLRVGCYDTATALPEAAEVATALRGTRDFKAALAALEQLVIDRETGRCGRVPREDLAAMFEAMRGNPGMTVEQTEQVLGLLGRLHAADGDASAALHAWDRAYATLPRAGTALLQAALAARAGQPGQARGYLEKARAASLNAPNREALEQQMGEIERRIAGGSPGASQTQ